MPTEDEINKAFAEKLKAGPLSFFAPEVFDMLDTASMSKDECKQLMQCLEERVKLIRFKAYEEMWK